MNARNAYLSVILGLGLALALLWLLGDNISSAVRTQGPDRYGVFFVAPSYSGVPSPCFTTIRAAVETVHHPGDIIKVAAGTCWILAADRAPIHKN